MSQVKQIVSNSKKAAMCCVFGGIHCITHCKTKCALANAQKSKQKIVTALGIMKFPQHISQTYKNCMFSLKEHCRHHFTNKSLSVDNRMNVFHSIFSLLNKWLQCWIPSLLLGLWLFLLQVPAKIKLWHQLFSCASFNIIKKINRTGTRTQKKLSKENS